MKTTKINLYSYEELSKEAKRRAISDYNKQNDGNEMQEYVNELIKQELDERGIKYDADSIRTFYSLGYSQGDGLMFEGILEDDHGSVIIIKHRGHYSHSNSRDIDYPMGSNADLVAFEAVYAEICKKIEKAGYDRIEQLESEENFIETCDVNEYTFEADGTMRNI